MNIQLRTLQGQVIKLTVQADDTIASLKPKLEAEKSIKIANNYKIILKSKVISDDATFKSISYNPKDYFVLYISPFPPEAAKMPHDIRIQTEQIHPNPAAASFSTENPASQEPAEFQEMVNSLIEMGFEREQCESALRLAHFIPDSAAALLLSGRVPPTQTSNPSAAHPEAPAARYGAHQAEFDAMTAAEKSSLSRIEALGLAPQVAIQTFLAVDKNEELAMACAQAMVE